MASCSTNSYDGRLATLTVTVASQSIENNQTTLSWELKVSGGKVNNYNAYAITAWVGGTDDAHKVYGPVEKAWDSYAFPAVKGTKTGTVVIDHNADGTHGQVQIRIRGSFYNNNPTNHDAYLDIPTIPRASNVSCDNVTLGNSVTINCPRASTGFTNNLYIKDGNDTIETFSGVGDSKSWTPSLANYGNRIVLSKQFTVQCDTYSGGTYIGTKYCYPTLSFPSGYGPTCSLSVSPNNSNCPSAWGNRYVQYKSMVNVSVGFSGQYGATLSNRTSTVPNAGTNSSASWVSNTLSTSGTLTVTASVTDNRNRTGNDSKQITVYPYFSPKITRALAERNNNTLTCTYSYEIASVDGANAHNFKIEYKKVSDSTWTTAVNNTSDLSKTNATATINNLEANSSYNIRFTVTDSTGSITQTASVGTVFDLMNFHSSGLAMAIGKMSEAGANEKLFEVGIPATFHDVTKFYNLINSIQEATGSNHPSRIRFIGNTTYNKLPEATTDTQTCCKALLKWVCSTYPNDTYTGYIGTFEPNAQGLVFLHIYSNSDKNSEGLPNHATCLYLGYGGYFYSFGTSYFNWYFNDKAISQIAVKNTDNNFSTSQTINGRTFGTAGFMSNEDTNSINTQSGYESVVIKKASSTYAPNNGVVLEYGPYSGWCGQLYIGDNADQGVWYNGWSGGVRGSWRKLAFDNEVGATVGTSGIWRYIKFNNGYAICIGRQRISTAIGTTWGNVYSSGDKALNDFPFTFTEVPYVSYSPHAGGDNGAGGYSYFVASGNASATTTNPGKILLLRGARETTARNFDVIITAFGRWK